MPLTFYLDRDREVSIQLIGEEDEVMWEYNMQGKKGINQYRWDLVTETVNNQGAYFVHYRKFPDAGTYKIRISGKGAVEDGKRI